MKALQKYILIGLAVMLSVSQAGVTKTGTTAAKFLNMGVGPRTIAMGGAYILSDNDAGAMYWNAAGIADTKHFQAIFTQSNWIAGIKLNYLGAVIPLQDMGVMGVNVTAVTMGDMQETTEYFPDGTGNTFSAGMFAIGLTYARYLTENFIIGANIKYVQENISNSTAQGVAIDIGTVFKTPFYGIQFATSISNFGTKMEISGQDLLFQSDPLPNSNGSVDRLNSYYQTDPFDLPLRLQIGISKEFKLSDDQRLSVAVDAAHPSDNSQFVNTGAEWAMFNERFFLRGGFKTLFLKDREEGLTLGAGFHYNSLGYLTFAIDYAYQQFKYLGDVHTFGVNIGF